MKSSCSRTLTLCWVFAALCGLLVTSCGRLDEAPSSINDEELLHAPVSSVPTNPSDCISRDTSACIDYADAGAHVGQTSCVCCLVERTYYAAGSSGKPTFLDCRDPYQGWFYSLIWIEDRPAFTSHFGQAPEQAFKGHKACFWGQIESYKGNPEIILRSPLDACISKSQANGS